LGRLGIEYEDDDEDEDDWGNDCEGASQRIIATPNAERRTLNAERS
jgi:hypothetical protein